jgi:hypothetical protein
MAKKNINIKNSSTEIKNGKNKTNGNASGAAGEVKEETSPGLMATVIAVVALLVVGGSIGAFLLFVKAKQKYLDPLTKSKTENVSSGAAGMAESVGDLGQGNESLSDGSLESLGAGVTSADAQLSMPAGQETAPVVPPTYYVPYTPPVTPETPQEEAPKPEKVDTYDFNSVISFADGKMGQTSEEVMNPSWMTDNYYGF